MKQIDERRLESDLAYRYEYLADFLGFTTEDVAVIHSLAAKLLPRIPAIVDATYEKLLSYTATSRHFLPRQHGYEGPLPESLETLDQQTEQIQFRKEHLQRYLMNIVGNSYDARMVKYLDVVGRIHTPQAGNKQIDVPQVQMNALMGLLADLLREAIADLSLDRDAEREAQQAVNKLLWIQNDLINRHYTGGDAVEPTPPAHAPPSDAWS